MQPPQLPYYPSYPMRTTISPFTLYHNSVSEYIMRTATSAGNRKRYWFEQYSHWAKDSFLFARCRISPGYALSTIGGLIPPRIVFLFLPFPPLWKLLIFYLGSPLRRFASLAPDIPLPPLWENAMVGRAVVVAAGENRGFHPNRRQAPLVSSMWLPMCICECTSYLSSPRLAGASPTGEVYDAPLSGVQYLQIEFSQYELTITYNVRSCHVVRGNHTYG